MCAALLRKITRRKAIRASVDVLHDEIKDVLTRFDEKDRTTLLGKRKTLTDEVEKLKELDEEIVNVVATEDMEQEICGTMM